MPLEHVCMFENPLPVMDFEHTYMDLEHTYMDLEHTYKHIVSQNFMFSEAFKHVCMFKILVFHRAKRSNINSKHIVNCFSLNHVCMFENPLPVMDFEHTYKHIATICALTKIKS